MPGNNYTVGDHVISSFHATRPSIYEMRVRNPFLKRLIRNLVQESWPPNMAKERTNDNNSQRNLRHNNPPPQDLLLTPLLRDILNHANSLEVAQEAAGSPGILDEVQVENDGALGLEAISENVVVHGIFEENVIGTLEGSSGSEVTDQPHDGRVTAPQTDVDNLANNILMHASASEERESVELIDNHDTERGISPEGSVSEVTVISTQGTDNIEDGRV